jgi:hypothetical protein
LICIVQSLLLLFPWAPQLPRDVPAGVGILCNKASLLGEMKNKQEKEVEQLLTFGIKICTEAGACCVRGMKWNVEFGYQFCVCCGTEENTQCSLLIIVRICATQDLEIVRCVYKTITVPYHNKKYYRYGLHRGSV